MSEQRQTISIELPQTITVRELAREIQSSPIEVIKTLMANGVMANINQQIDFDTAAIVAAEMGFEAAADRAIIAIKELERDIYVHTECETEVRTKFVDGLAQYELWAKLGGNPAYISDVIELRRHEPSTCTPV